MSKPALHSKAPAFSAAVTGGTYTPGSTISLKDLLGKPVVLYFYPKDDTPGCTKQACALRDSWAAIKKKAQIFGISPDSIKSHGKFITKHELPFPLIADEDQAIAEASTLISDDDMAPCDINTILRHAKENVARAQLVAQLWC